MYHWKIELFKVLWNNPTILAYYQFCRVIWNGLWWPWIRKLFGKIE